MQVIVTCDTALVVNVERVHEPAVQSFIEDLQHRLSVAGGALSADPSGDGAASADSPPRSSAMARGGEPAMHENGMGSIHVNGDVDLLHEQPRGGGTALGEGPVTEADAHQVDADAERTATEIAAGMAGSAREAIESEVPYELKVPPYVHTCSVCCCQQACRVCSAMCTMLAGTGAAPLLMRSGTAKKRYLHLINGVQAQCSAVFGRVVCFCSHRGDVCALVAIDPPPPTDSYCNAARMVYF